MAKADAPDQIMTSAKANRAPLGLYIHWPFCLAKCPYCDFNSHVSDTVDMAAFGDALCQEMTHMAGLLAAPRPLTSLFFGGGTPSLMTPALVGRVIDHANKLFGFDPAVEITAEANPTSVEAGRMLAFRRTGVNRVSMGVQSLDDKVLAFLGRAHSAAEAQYALDTIRTAFDHVSIDLIYATPGQTKATWRQQLEHVLAFDLTHLSLYQLTIEPGTVFYSRQRRGEVMTVNDDRAAALYDITQEMTGLAGLPAYEISNHAKPGYECRHNLTYWQGGDWLGIGPGAHGRFTNHRQNGASITRHATRTRRSPAGWLQAVFSDGHGIDEMHDDSVADWAAEMVMMGLRLHSGINLTQIEQLCGPQTGWLDRAGFTACIDAGWLDYDKARSQLAASDAGRVRLNSILAKILA
jgi:putative oxygen-independent coproporphyrinogen III oxidase